VHAERFDLDRALAGPAFSVDPTACSAAANVLKTLTVHTPSCSLRRPLSREILFRLAVTAICHKINWDFLSDRLGLAFDQLPLDATALAALSSRDIERWLDGYDKPERIRAKKRAALLRDIGKQLVHLYHGSAESLIRASDNRLYDKDGLVFQLDSFEAFREDPLRKKSNVLIHELVRDRVVRFKDEDKIVPAIDYHVMRLYLRTGRVVPLHTNTMDLLKSDSTPRPRLVKLLREAVAEALSLTALYARMSIPQVNSLEWQLGRDICERASPHCESVPPISQQRLGWSNNFCPNASFCQAYRSPEWRLLREPDLNKSFY
jgi:hypothetical protein